MTEVKRRIVRRAAFRQWLEQQPNHARYRPCMPEFCPLAAFSGYLVGSDTYGDDTHDLLPLWAREFRLLFDSCRRATGPIVCGPRHFDAVMRETIQRLGLPVEGAIQGFVDQFGAFLARDEAHLVAYRAGQIASHRDGDRLYSEDLY